MCRSPAFAAMLLGFSLIFSEAATLSFLNSSSVSFENCSGRLLRKVSARRCSSSAGWVPDWMMK